MISQEDEIADSVFVQVISIPEDLVTKSIPHHIPYISKIILLLKNLTSDM